MIERNRREFLALSAAGSAVLAGCQGIAPRPFSSNDDEDSDEKINDWQYDPPDEEDRLFAGADDMEGANIGLSVGGAADVGTFRRNVAEGYLPIPESMAYEGLFYDYYFDTGGDGSCESLFCPTYTPAITDDPFSGETNRFLSVGLDSGLAVSDFERPPLNLVIVLDISGSMRSSFDRYYYDRFGNEQELDEEPDRSKMEVAKEVLVDLTHHLRPDDRLGVVLFNHESHVAKPLRTLETTDMDAIRTHIEEDVYATGGTNISAAMEDAEDLLDEVVDESGEYEHRSILLTDAQINWGETDADELRSSLEARAERRMHTSVVGIGVDFNADLINQITAVRGANYYSVYSSDQFEQRMIDEFEYMVTPLVYDLSLELDADGYDITRVYGSPIADEATGELLYVNTLFPSPSEDGKAKGGVILVQVERTDDALDNGEIELTASWERRDGSEESAIDTVEFPSGNEEYWGSTAIRKAVLLARYADLLKSWTVDERESTDVSVDDEIEPPAYQPGTWELQSEPLRVSEKYTARIQSFADHFEHEIVEIGDETLQQEIELMEEILAVDDPESEQVE